MTDPKDGTKHVGVRREGAGVWLKPGPGWECYDRGTGNRIGPVHPTKYEAQAYAEDRQRTTFGD